MTYLCIRHRMGIWQHLVGLTNKTCSSPLYTRCPISCIGVFTNMHISLIVSYHNYICILI